MPATSNVLAFPSAASDDAPARLAALDVRRSAIVEAPAGSGKTGLLVQRFLKLLADANTMQPEEVLAVTFTNKATAELLDRVLQQLQAANARSALPAAASGFERETRNLAERVLARDRELDWGLLAQPSRLQVRTFDAICVTLANGLPLLSGSHGARKPSAEAQPLYGIAARRTLMQLGGADARLTAALTSILLHRDASLGNVEPLLAGMLATRDQWGELIPLDQTLDDRALDEQVRPRLERALEAAVCAGLNHALRSIPASILEEIAAFAARHAELPGYKDATSPIALCAGRHEPPEAVAEHLEHWTALVDLLTLKELKWRKGMNVNQIGFALDKSEKARLLEIIDELRDHADSEQILETLCDVRCLPPARYPEEQWTVAKALFSVLRHALVELKLLFAERNEADFIEFSLAARMALRSSSGGDDESPAGDVLSSGGRLRHLLVDEMQDTSSAQYELIELLTASWDGHSQTLFLVGDPKQSIYLFRQARVERFLRTMRACRLGEIPLTALQLTSNFRSQGSLVEDFNASFEVIFPTPGPARGGSSEPSASDVPFVAARSTRPAANGGGIAWHTRSLGDGETLHAVRREEAAEIRCLVEQTLAADEEARVAVLAASRSHLADIVSEFKKDRGDGSLPFRGIDLDPLDGLPEVLDLLALTRALSHPADRTAWLAVLHAPWCGLGMADLLALTGEGPGADADATVLSLLAARTPLLSAVGQQLVARVLPTLVTAVSSMGRTPLSLHVERTWRSVGGDAPLNEEALANTEQFFWLMRQLEAEVPTFDSALLASRLKRLYAAPKTGEHIRVELLTIHRAKGLEWDVVFVPGLERKPQGSSEDLLNWLELDCSSADASIVLAPIGGRGLDSSRLNDWLRGQRGRREAAERKRLFYVAATRAREHLHLFASLERKQDGSLCTPGKTTLLHAAWPAAEAHFVPPSGVASLLEQSLAVLEDIAEFEEPLALAASQDTQETKAEAYPLLARLPLNFVARERFQIPVEERLFPSLPAAVSGPAFARPEGSFAVRAFGNVVHRFLQVIAERLAVGANAEALRAELPGWLPRLRTSFRGEGLAPAVAAREAERALDALLRTLADPVGTWLLAPHPLAASESPLTAALAGRSLRIDRTFVAGEKALEDEPTHVWIVDFKTTGQGSRSAEDFAASEIAKYSEQMQAYGSVHRSLPGETLPIRLALYYPLVPRLIEIVAS